MLPKSTWRVVEDHDGVGGRPATDEAFEIERRGELAEVILPALSGAAAEPGQAGAEHLDDPVVAKLGSAELPEPLVATVRGDGQDRVDAALHLAAGREGEDLTAVRSGLAAGADPAGVGRVFVDRDRVAERRCDRLEEGDALPTDGRDLGDERVAPLLDRLWLVDASIGQAERALPIREQHEGRARIALDEEEIGGAAGDVAPDLRAAGHPQHQVAVGIARPRLALRQFAFDGAREIVGAALDPGLHQPIVPSTASDPLLTGGMSLALRSKKTPPTAL